MPRPQLIPLSPLAALRLAQLKKAAPHVSVTLRDKAQAQAAAKIRSRRQWAKKKALKAEPTVE